MEAMELYIPGDVVRDNQIIPIIHDYYNDLIKEMWTDSNIDIKGKMVNKARSLNEDQLAEYLNTFFS